MATADQARDKRARSVSILGAEKASGEWCTREVSRRSRRRRTAALLSLLLPRERVAEIGVTGRNARCVHHAHRCVTCTTVQGPAVEGWNEHLRMLLKDSSFDRARLGDQPRSTHFVIGDRARLRARARSSPSNRPPCVQGPNAYFLSIANAAASAARSAIPTAIATQGSFADVAFGRTSAFEGRASRSSASPS